MAKLQKDIDANKAATKEVLTKAGKRKQKCGNDKKKERKLKEQEDALIRELEMPLSSPES